MSFNKLISFTIVYILLAVYVSYSSFTLYELRKTNEYLIQMTEYQANLLEQTNEDVKLIDRQIEAEKAAAPPEEEEESFVPKQDKFMKEDIKLKKEMNDIMKSVLSES